MSRAMSNADREAAFTRLPKWAQDRLRSAERRVAFLEREITEGGAGSDTFKNVTGVDRKGLGLGESPSIVFFPDPADDRQRIQVRITTQGTLQIMAERGLVIYSQSSNVIQVRDDWPVRS